MAITPLSTRREKPRAGSLSNPSLLSFAFPITVIRCHLPHPALSSTGGEDTGEEAYVCNHSIAYEKLKKYQTYKEESNGNGKIIYG
jgi:hypothetical protein